MDRLPPLNLNAVRGSEDQDQPAAKLSARERRRERVSYGTTAIIPGSGSRKGSVNEAYEDTEERPRDRDERRGSQVAEVSEKPKRRARRSESKPAVGDNNASTDLPPSGLKRKRRRATSTVNFESKLEILDGLEEDVVEIVNEDEMHTGRTESHRELLPLGVMEYDVASQNLGGGNGVKSVPTDKLYLELDRKFTIQSKQMYEKKEKERQKVMEEEQARLKRREELKYQISTTRTALFTHKVLSSIFLFLQGINAGFQVWMAVIIYLINYKKFDLTGEYADNPFYSNNTNYEFFSLFESITQPSHCLSYFLLVVCIIDCMDRVDLAKMSVPQFIKCVSFQNQFWAIFLYLVALVFSLSIINIDEAVYANLYLGRLNMTSNISSTAFIDTINQGGSIWKPFHLVTAIFSLFGWFMCSILIRNDRLRESLVRRDTPLFDDMFDDDSKKKQEKKKAISDQAPVKTPVKSEDPMAPKETNNQTSAGPPKSRQASQADLRASTTTNNKSIV